jgi:tetratricopeptide (TPR) repeat protein
MKYRNSQLMIAGLLALLLAGGCARSPEAKRDRFLASGKKLMASKDYARAILEFKNAVAAVPRDAEGYYQLGSAYAASGNLPLAVSSLRKATELNPRHAEAQLKLAQFMAAFGDKAILEEAEQRLKTLLEGGHSDPNALNTLALTELRLGRPENATQYLEQALDRFPQNLKTSMMLAKLKISQKDLKGAEEVLQKACQQDPKSAEPPLALGRFYWASGRSAEALQQFEQAIRINPQSGPALMDLAMTQNAAGRKPEAEQNFKRLAGFPGKAYEAVYGIFLFQENRRDEAIREFERLAKQNPDDRVARTRLITAYLASQRTADAQRVIEAALRKSPKDLDALLQQSEILLEAGKLSQAQENLNQVLHLKPDSAEAHYILARVHEKRGTMLNARQELSEALRLNPNLLQVRLEMAQLLIANNAAKTALELLDGTPDGQKGLLPVLVQRNWALAALGRREELAKAVEAGLAREQTPDLLMQDGIVKLNRGDFAGAKARLEEALKAAPDDLRALQVLTEAYMEQKRGPEAIERVKRYAAERPQSAPAQSFLGKMLLANGDRTAARTALEAAKKADPGMMDVDLALVQLDTAEGKWDSARQTLASVLKTHGPNATAHLWLGNIEAVQRNYPGAINQYRKAVDADNSNVLALNNLAYFLAEHAQQADEALKYAEKAKELAPESADVEDTLGWIYYRKGLYSMAVRHLEAASSQGSRPVRKYHLAMAYAKSGDAARARQTLAAAMKLDPDAAEAKMARELIAQAP